MADLAATSTTPKATTSPVTSRSDPQASDPSASAVEMSTLDKTHTSKAEQTASAEAGSSIPVPLTDNDSAAGAPDSSSRPAGSEEASASSSPAKGKEKEKETAAASRARPDSLSIDHDPPAGAEAAGSAENPTCRITLLLPTGARHPYKIDEKYLSKRNVEIPDLTEDGKKDPFSISIYKLKELILREWREEWEGKPASPSSIRLIHFGKLLDDKEQLKKYHLSAESPNVIHMSVRPAEMMEDEEGAKGKSAGSGANSRNGGGCCVIL